MSPAITMVNSTKLSAKNIKRLPFRLAMMIWSSENCRLIIASPDASDYDLEESFPLGLPIDMAAFIHMHCRCAHCGASISRDLSRCPCGKPKDRQLHLEVEYPTEIDHSVFKPIIEREGGRIKSLKRKQRIEANGGSFSKDDVAALYDIQEGICYFCGNSISMAAQGNSFHVDHYQAIYDGGRNDLSNIVLACSSCNMSKGVMHGDAFERVARKMRSPDVGRKLGKIRKRLNAFRANKSRAL